MKKILLYLTISLCCLTPALAQLPPASFFHLKSHSELVADQYHCLAEDEYGFIWFGSYHTGGLYRFDGYNLRSIVADPNKAKRSLSNSNISTIYSYGDGYLYVGTHYGWNAVDILNGTVRSYANRDTMVPNYDAYYIEPIIKDASNRLWIGSGYGLSLLPSLNDTMIWLKNYKSKGPDFDPGTIDLIFDKRDPDLLWLGTRSGVLSYHIRNGEYEFYGPEASMVNNPLVFDLVLDEDNVLWASFPNDKVGKLLPEHKKWEFYDVSVQNKNQGGGALHMLDVGNHKMWVGTMEAVGLLDTENGDFELWTYEADRPDGLLKNGFYRALLNDRHGRLWITGNQGIMYAKEPFLPPSDRATKLVVSITDVITEGANMQLDKPLIFRQALEFEKEHKNITFKYVFPNPLYPTQVIYEYKLDGYDKDWIQTDQRTVQYTNLAGGKYAFKVKAKEKGDASFTGITSLAIHVEKKLVEQWWFWLISISSLLGLTAGGFWLRISSVRKEEKLKAQFKQDLAKIQMQALRAQMNPHFLFNCLNSIKYYALNKDKDATANYLSKFSLLVRTILNNSKSASVSLKDELEAIRLYIEIESLRLENKFNYEMDIDSSLMDSSIQIPPMVLQPYIENAIWHGLMPKESKGKLLVRVKDLGDSIQCIIEDNGIGREKSAALAAKQPKIKKSLGMSITKDRLQLIRDIHQVEINMQIIDLNDQHGHALGTRVVVDIPY